MNGVSIVSTGKYLPSKVVSNDDLSKMVETSDEWIVKRTGISKRHLCDMQANLDLAYNAGKMALDRAEIDKSKIGVLIVTTFTNDYATPSMANLLVDKLGLNRNIMAFDINVACSSFAYALKVAQSLLATMPNTQYALVIGSEELSKMVDFSDRASCVLFGDGAGSLLVKANNSVFASEFGSMSNPDILYCGSKNGEKQFIQMNGKEVFKFAVSIMPEVIDNLLIKANLTIDDIDYVICHQANKRIIESVAKKYNCEEKFLVNIENYGNTSSASIPILIDEAYESGKIKKGNKIICVGFGAGLAWGGVLWEV